MRENPPLSDLHLGRGLSLKFLEHPAPNDLRRLLSVAKL